MKGHPYFSARARNAASSFFLSMDAMALTDFGERRCSASSEHTSFDHVRRGAFVATDSEHQALRSVDDGVIPGRGVCLPYLAIGRDEQDLEGAWIDAVERRPIPHPFRQRFVFWPETGFARLLHERNLRRIDDRSAASGDVAIDIVERPSEIAPQNVDRERADGVGSRGDDRDGTEGAGDAIGKNIAPADVTGKDADR